MGKEYQRLDFQRWDPLLKGPRWKASVESALEKEVELSCSSFPFSSLHRHSKGWLCMPLSQDPADSGGRPTTMLGPRKAQGFLPTPNYNEHCVCLQAKDKDFKKDPEKWAGFWGCSLTILNTLLLPLFCFFTRPHRPQRATVLALNTARVGY